MMSLKERLQNDDYEGYAYSYPHKTAYRPLEPSLPLEQVWSGEDKSQLFLYLHLPFCEVRCGFCNLFTTIRPRQDFVERTLRSIERQITQVAEAVKPQGVAQMAIGGGTPSYLSEAQITRLLSLLEKHWPVHLGEVPFSLEVSPSTVTPQKLALLKQLGVNRLSMGVQSFVSEDLEALRRPLLGADLHEVCAWIRDTNFPVFNLDLIYGVEGQDPKRWEQSLAAALRWQPEELYLYPLYVGKLTSLDRLNQRPGAHRRALYRQARERLIEAGYQQISMRLFRRPGVTQDNDYCCQQDGMVGLGPGARSYTRGLHYSTDYAVGQPGVKAIISAFSDLDYGVAHYGARLDDEEQKRRFVLKSLLRVEGLDNALYQAQFQSQPFDDLPQLQQLLELGLAINTPAHLTLTPEGLAYSDTIGPWLYSAAVKESMREYEFH